MSSTSCSSSTQLQGFLGRFHSRKLLTHNPLSQQAINAALPPQESSSLDKNDLMILSVLICSVIFTFVLNSLIRCALSCLRLVSSESIENSTGPRRSVRKGIKRKVLNTFPVVNYSTELKLPGLDAECVICLSEFASGEYVRILPKRSHGFHIRCIDKWPRSNYWGPKCRLCLVETSEKIDHGVQQAG